MTSTLPNRWRVLAELVPKLVACLLILVIGYIVVRVIAKAIDKVLDKVLVRVSFDRAVERSGLSRRRDPSGRLPAARRHPRHHEGPLARQHPKIMSRKGASAISANCTGGINCS